MIGKVVFTEGIHAGTEAVMDDRGEWSHENPVFQIALKYEYAPHQHGPAVMPFGHNAIYAAADKFGGKAVIENPPEPLPDGVIS